ncbi:MAG: hypothetical protein GY816_00730 [Cytophagales bacterium]|nr:hypothetical protein [Cytophagales bacterium]
MNELIEKLAYKIGEGFQASSLLAMEANINAFHRNVTIHESSDLSFINGLISSGLRGSACLDGEKVTGNHNQLLTAARQHLPLVVNTNARVVDASSHSTLNNNEIINGLSQTGCFQFVACSAQEEIYLTLLAHRVAELSLIPGVVISDYDPSNQKATIPKDELIKSYLGNPDDQIVCPTPAQEMIFGKTRRRIPNWFSLDTPVMLGAKKDGEAMAFETAANQKYFQDHLPQLIDQSIQEFKDVFDIEIKSAELKGQTSDYGLISIGGLARELFDQLANSDNAELLTVNQLSPFPYSIVEDWLKGKKAITILEYSSVSIASNSHFYSQILKTVKDAGVKIYSAKYGADILPDALQKCIEHMVSNQPRTDYFIGLEFTKESSGYPKHDILLHEIEKRYPELANASIQSVSTATSSSEKHQDEIPLAIRKYQDNGPKYSHLARFYDDTAFFYEHNEREELVADPFAAIPVIPSASASFFSQADERKYLPTLDVEKCTGCGDCFVQCPHSAIPPIAITVEQLVKAGVDIAASKGAAITKLTPLYKNLAKVAAQTIGETEVSKVGDFLPTAFENLVVQMKLSGAKLEATKEEFEAVLIEIEEMPVAITDQFFDKPNSLDQGNGELFSLAVNPAACTGCSICAQVCDERALNMEPQTSENLEKATAQFKLWELLPDTAGETIKRLHQEKDYSSLAAMMLSRSFHMAMSGASNSDKDTPYKTLLHIVTSTAESVIQPKIVDQLKQIDELINSLTENIHGKLSEALPKDNLDALTKSLRDSQSSRLSIQDVVNRISEHEHSKLIDTAGLGRKTDLVEDLKNLRWALMDGPTGVGRSRFGMLLSGSNSLEWAKQYPYNNFTSPSVIHWNGSAPDQTLGLFHGQLRYLLDNIKLMRRAQLESKDKYDQNVHDLEIAFLNWDDLTEEEKQLIPPILLVAERDDLNESGWSSLNKLMAEKYPVNVFLFDHVASPGHSPVSALAQTNAGMFSTIALKNAFVFQGGLGDADHLFNGLLDGLDRPYPALFNLYATKLEKHGLTQIDWSPFASLALSSRAFPSLRYDPGEKSDFLSGAISLDANRNNTQDWVLEEIPLSDEETIEYQITWADWAFTQSNWENQFAKVEEDDSNLSIAEYISLDEKARQDKIPVIRRSSNDGLKYYSASDRVIGMTEAVLSNWNTLQELAGLLTEFPTKLRDKVTEELSKKYEQDAAELKRNYEQQLGEQQAGQTEVLRQQLKEKLVALSSMAQNKIDA